MDLTICTGAPIPARLPFRNVGLPEEIENDNSGPAIASTVTCMYDVARRGFWPRRVVIISDKDAGIHAARYPAAARSIPMRVLGRRRLRLRDFLFHKMPRGLPQGIVNAKWRRPLEQHSCGGHVDLQ